MQKWSNAPPGLRDAVDEPVRHVHGLNRRKANLRNRGLAQNDTEKLVDLDMLVVRTRAIIGTEVDTGEHHLGKPRFLDVAHLFEYGIDGHGALGAARLPHDAVGAAVVATVLDLHAHARLPERRLARLAIAPRALLKPEELEGARDDLDLGGNDRHSIGEVSKRLWMQRRGATGGHHERLAGTTQGVADRLAGLRLGLPRHRAGVDNDKLSLVLIDEREARL